MITLTEAAAYYRASAERCEAELSTIVVTVIERAGELARGYIGQQQNGWPMAWSPLSSATVEGFRHRRGFWVPGKESLGYGGYDSPMLRTGNMRDSIETNVVELFGEVGSNDKKALFQEMGTPGADYPIPPRPFLAKGLMDASYQIEELAGEVAFDLLLPKV